MTPFTPYQRRLFVFLSIATFFEGYDFIALSQVLPNLRASFDLSEAQGGLLGSVISLGTILAYILVRLADRFGRRRILLLSILGYSGFTMLSGLAFEAYDFAAFQFAARMFQIAAWAVSMIIAAEEFPAERRGFVLGVIQACNSLGVVVCAALVPWLLRTPTGWRTVYFVGVAPIFLLPWARKRLKETALFAAHAERTPEEKRGLLTILRSPYRNRVLQLALIWGLTYMSTNTALLFWKEFAVGERGFTDIEVGHAVLIASLLAAPFVFGVGRVIDHFGRRTSAVLIYGTSAFFVVLAYNLHDFWLLTVCLSVAIVMAIALLTLLNALTTELFPTAMRADAFAWANNLLGRIGYVIAPAVVGFAASNVGWSWALSFTALPVLSALALILWFVPETGGKTLRETAKL